MKNRFKLLLILTFLYSCQKTELVNNSRLIAFGVPQRVTITGYDDHAMEPFLSRDGNTLFFNNSNHPSENTNLHYAIRVNDVTFEYQGAIGGINTEYLEGVATLDSEGKMFFVSTRNYFETLASVYTGQYSNGQIANVEIVQGISKNTAGWLNFDVEISSDGNSLFFVDGRFDENGGPYEANIFVASRKSSIEFERLADQKIMQNINTSALEYAACISSDLLELYFTRVDAPISAESSPKIYVATRESINESFNNPYRIESITGFVEAATLSPNDSLLYYHKLEGDKFVLYLSRKEK
jgi:hypothetical protein